MIGFFQNFLKHDNIILKPFLNQEKIIMNEIISKSSKIILLQVARKSLENYLKNKREKSFKVSSSDLLQYRAVFVTLWEKNTGQLRGCIGHSEARYPLIKAVADTVISSASEDPRFNSLTEDELKNILIEINVLSKFKRILPNEIEIGKHGLMLCKGSYSSLFLPDVPISQGWDIKNYLEQLSLKAGLNIAAWKDQETEIHSFESESWAEN